MTKRALSRRTGEGDGKGEILMTLRQEAYEKMAGLSDNSLRLVIALVEEMRKQSSPQPDAASDADEKRAAFLDAINHRRLNPFPKDIDVEKLREEAIIEKYGRFD
jgi:hypothetical protein